MLGEFWKKIEDFLKIFRELLKYFRKFSQISSGWVNLVAEVISFVFLECWRLVGNMSVWLSKRWDG